jgi:mono/diheme cytochrome c family protein
MHAFAGTRGLPQRRWLCALALAANACVARPESPPLPTDASPERRGALVYVEHCAKCHDG